MALNSRLSRLCAIELAGEIALHLRLVRPEIGEREKHTADQPAPDVVPIVPVEARHHGVQPSRRARQRKCIPKRYVARQQIRSP